MLAILQLRSGTWRGLVPGVVCGGEAIVGVLLKRELCDWSSERQVQSITLVRHIHVQPRAGLGEKDSEVNLKLQIEVLVKEPGTKNDHN